MDSYLPWVEKYRPQSIEEVVSHHDIISTIERFIAKDQLPHLLLHGPPGTGKTSTVQAIARKLHGKDYRQMVLELNASDDRGIDVVRNTIKSFAETQAMQPGRLLFKPIGKNKDVNMESDPNSRPNSRISSVKLVILDEADQMTGAAQMALRRIVEKFAETVRFVIVCNYVNKVIPALQSRCTKFRFAPLKAPEIRQRTLQIAASEGVDLTDDGMDALIRIAKGDMRKILNTLQSACMSNANETINEKKVLETVGLPSTENINHILQLLPTSTFRDSFEGVLKIVSQNGYALSDVNTAIFEKMVTLDLPTSTACVLFPRLAAIESRLSHGADETIQIGCLVACFTEIRADLQKLRQMKAEMKV